MEVTGDFRGNNDSSYNKSRTVDQKNNMGNAMVEQEVPDANNGLKESMVIGSLPSDED